VESYVEELPRRIFIHQITLKSALAFFAAKLWHNGTESFPRFQMKLGTSSIL